MLEQDLNSDLQKPVSLIISCMLSGSTLACIAQDSPPDRTVLVSGHSWLEGHSVLRLDRVIFLA